MSLHDTKSQTVIENYQPNDTWEQETGAHQSFVSSNYQTPNFQLLKSWLATSNFSLSWLPTSNFLYDKLPTSNFLQNLLPTSNFLQNLLPTSNFFIEIEGGTVPPSISYFCSPGWGGLVGGLVDGDHMTPSNLFILGYIKHYPHIYTNIY